MKQKALRAGDAHSFLHLQEKKQIKHIEIKGF